MVRLRWPWNLTEPEDFRNEKDPFKTRKKRKRNECWLATESVDVSAARY